MCRAPGWVRGFELAVEEGCRDTLDIGAGFIEDIIDGLSTWWGLDGLWGHFGKNLEQLEVGQENTDGKRRRSDVFVAIA